MVNFHFPMVEIPFPDISSPKTQSVDLFCFSILMYSSVQSLVIESQGSTKSDVLKFGPVSEQEAETTFHKETAIFFQPNVSWMLIYHHDQMTELFCQILEQFCPFFVQIAQMGLILPRWGLILPRVPRPTPVLYSAVTHSLGHEP